MLIASLLSLSGCAQEASKNIPSSTDTPVGGSCEGCEAVFESQLPFDLLDPVDTLPDFNTPGPRLLVRGIIYQPGGKKPAAGVVLYVYHTDQEGIYPKKADETGYARQHGYLRGWVKTNENGEYAFYTLVPASYPNSRNPKHIHAIIKEPGKTAYWIDDFVFSDDPLLNDQEKNRKKPAGGNGLLNTKMKNGILEAGRNIELGLNINSYPRTK